MNQLTNKKGFTIIEVVLVLAIAALIFLMIFVAFPALQRGQKNTARKDDLNTIASAVNTYRSNHSGSLPSATSDLSSYIDKLSQIDTGSVEVVANDFTLPTASDADIDKAWVVKSATCKDDGTYNTTSSKKSAAIITITQNSSGTSGYGFICQSV